jgi:hypothetical protein
VKPIITANGGKFHRGDGSNSSKILKGPFLAILAKVAPSLSPMDFIDL